MAAAGNRGLSRQTITTADDQELVDEAISGVHYFYAKNTDSTNFVILQTTASVQYARLSPGEFCFFPINDSNGLEARADTASLEGNSYVIHLRTNVELLRLRVKRVYPLVHIILN